MSWEEDEAEYVRYLEQEIGKRNIEIDALKVKIAEIGRLNTVLQERDGELSVH